MLEMEVSYTNIKGKNVLCNKKKWVEVVAAVIAL